MTQIPATSRGSTFGGASSIFLSQSGNTDIRAIGNHDLAFDQAFNNCQDAVPLTAVPGSLGLSLAIDGSSATITVVDVGAWAYELVLGLVTGVDATLKAWLAIPAQLASAPFGPITAGLEVLTVGVSVSGIFTAAPGDTFRVRVHTDAAATANPYNAQGSALFYRVA